MIGDFEMWPSCPVGISMPGYVKELEAEKPLVRSLLAQGKQMNPLTYHLHEIDWALFVTLTWDNDAMSSFYYSDTEQLRQRDFFWAMRQTCTKLNIRMRDLVWYYKTESGQNQRAHGNVLIGKQGLKAITALEFARILENVWTMGRYPKGLAQVAAFNPDLHLQGILYQTKNEFDSKGVPLPFAEELSGPLKKILYNQVVKN